MPVVASQEEKGRLPVPLSTLRDGQRGRVQATDLCCDDCALLTAMGLTDQCEIRVCQGGEPCIVQVRSTRLGISAALARRILVATDLSAG